MAITHHREFTPYGVPVRGPLWAVLIDGLAGEPFGQSTHLEGEGGDHRERSLSGCILSLFEGHLVKKIFFP